MKPIKLTPNDQLTIATVPGGHGIVAIEDCAGDVALMTTPEALERVRELLGLRIGTESEVPRPKRRGRKPKADRAIEMLDSLARPARKPRTPKVRAPSMLADDGEE